MRLYAKDDTAQNKQDIQSVCREIAIKRDGGCVLRHYPETGKCGPYKKNGELVLQYDHLNTRARNISFADTRLGVCVCQRHHIFYKPQHPAEYENIIRDVIGPERTALLDKVRADQKTYKMVWPLELTALKKELSTYD